MKIPAKKYSRARLAAHLMGSASFAIFGLASSAHAQDAASRESVESITVTGTMIKGIAPIGSNVITVDTQTIKETGAVTSDQVLANVPQITNLFSTVPNGSQISGRSTSFPPAIRNLDTSGHTTLVLINGADVVGDGGLQTTTDAQQIPALALQRVDVVLDGGSALYGAEAVAGVINFVTRKSFEGLEGSATVGATQNGYQSSDLGVIGGHAWSSGSAYLAFESRNNSHQMVANVPFPRSNLIPLGGTVNSDVKQCPSPNIGVGATNYVLNKPNVPNAPGALAAAVTLGTNLCDPLLTSSFYPQEDQNTFWGQLNQEIMPGVDFSLIVNWAHNDVVGLNPQMTATATVNNKNPFFQSIAGETQQTVNFDFSPLDGPNFKEVTRIEQYGIMPKLDIALGGSWNLNLLTSWQKAKNYRDAPQPDTVALNNALVSPDPNFALDPYNLSLTAAAADHITNYRQVFASTQHLGIIKPVVTGTLFTLPGGDLKLAAGYQYEYAQYAGYDVTGPEGQNMGPPVFGGLFITSDAKRTTHSVFGELVIPVVGKEMGIPLVDTLTLDVQGRYDHYSDFGGTTNPKFGLTWEPLSGLTIRGTLGTSFGAPNLGDTEAAVDTRASVALTSSIRVPTSISGVSAAQDLIDASRPSISTPGGSPGLVPQTAHTNSYGAEYQPDFLPGLDLSLEAWHVSMQKIIAIIPYTTANIVYTTPAYSPFYIINPTLAQVIAFTTLPNGQPIAQQGFAGYAQYYPANGAACPQINLATGCTQLTPYLVRDLRRHNLGNQFNSGIDFHVSYATDFDFGSMTFGLDGTDYTLYKTQGFTGGPVTDGLVANYAPYQFSTHVGLATGPFNSKVTVNYIAGYTVAGVTSQTYVSPFVLTNLMLSYDLNGIRDFLSGAAVTLYVNNVFDEQSPFINTGQGYPISPIYESTLGRFFQINLTKKF